MKAVQHFSDEYLARCQDFSPEEILDFLEGFRTLHQPAGPSRLISMKVPQDLLDAFRLRCRAEGTPYQTRIKTLMRAWLSGESVDY